MPTWDHTENSIISCKLLHIDFAFPHFQEVVSVSQEFLQSINYRINQFRPRGRLHKVVDIHSKFALSWPDLTFLYPVNKECDKPVFCVEIKVSWFSFQKICPCLSMWMTSESQKLNAVSVGHFCHPYEKWSVMYC